MKTWLQKSWILRRESNKNANKHKHNKSYHDDHLFDVSWWSTSSRVASSLLLLFFSTKDFLPKNPQRESEKNWSHKKASSSLLFARFLSKIPRKLECSSSKKSLKRATCKDIKDMKRRRRKEKLRSRKIRGFFSGKEYSYPPPASCFSLSLSSFCFLTSLSWSPPPLLDSQTSLTSLWLLSLRRTWGEEGNVFLMLPTLLFTRKDKREDKREEEKGNLWENEGERERDSKIILKDLLTQQTTKSVRSQLTVKKKDGFSLKMNWTQ